MRSSIDKIIQKSVMASLKREAIFEYDWQPDHSMNLDYNYYWSFPMPNDDVNHYTDRHEDEPYETLDEVVDRDKYPEESGGQGELDTVDYWVDTGNHYYVVEPAFDSGYNDSGKHNLQFYKDYLDV